MRLLTFTATLFFLFEFVAATVTGDPGLRGNFPTLKPPPNAAELLDQLELYANETAKKEGVPGYESYDREFTVNFAQGLTSPQLAADLDMHQTFADYNYGKTCGPQNWWDAISVENIQSAYDALDWRLIFHEVVPHDAAKYGSAINAVYRLWAAQEAARQKEQDEGVQMIVNWPPVISCESPIPSSPTTDASTSASSFSPSDPETDRVPSSTDTDSELATFATTTDIGTRFNPETPVPSVLDSTGFTPTPTATAESPFSNSTESTTSPSSIATNTPSSPELTPNPAALAPTSSSIGPDLVDLNNLLGAVTEVLSDLLSLLQNFATIMLAITDVLGNISALTDRVSTVQTSSQLSLSSTTASPANNTSTSTLQSESLTETITPTSASVPLYFTLTKYNTPTSSAATVVARDLILAQVSPRDSADIVDDVSSIVKSLRAIADEIETDVPRSSELQIALDKLKTLIDQLESWLQQEERRLAETSSKSGSSNSHSSSNSNGSSPSNGHPIVTSDESCECSSPHSDQVSNGSDNNGSGDNRYGSPSDYSDGSDNSAESHSAPSESYGSDISQNGSVESSPISDVNSVGPSPQVSNEGEIAQANGASVLTCGLVLVLPWFVVLS